MDDSSAEHAPRPLAPGIGIVVGVLALGSIAALGLLVTGNRYTRCDLTRDMAMADIIGMRSRVEAYAIEHEGRFPPTLAELLGHSPPVDPWGNPYVYEPPSGGRDLEIASYGADGTPGGTGQDADIDLASFHIARP